MKRTILILATILCTISISAQHHRKFDSEKFKADLHKYITTEAHLTQAEAAKFFPLYNEMKMKQMNLYKKGKAFKNKPTTEEGCRKAIMTKDTNEIKMKQIERTYHTKFLKVISASKLYDVLRAEDKFYAKAFKNAANKDGHKHKK